MICYLPLTVVVTEHNTKFRRAQNRLANERTSRLTDALINYETIAYFTNALHEYQAYLGVVDAYQRHARRMDVSYVVLNLLQVMMTM